MDWLKEDYSTYIPQEFISYPGQGFSSVSPFWTDRENLSWLSGYNTDGVGIDYLPEEGWELIVHRLGITDSGLIDPEFYGPYFLLYNKYRSMFRLFFNIPSIDGSSVNNSIVTSMQFNGQEEGVTGLFENIDGLSNPLDQATGDIHVEAYSNPVEGGWNVVEFPLAYDPCTCLKGSSITTSFRSVLSADVNMTGISIGTSTPLALFEQNHFDDKDRLMSVLENGVNPEIGTETYKNIEAWIDKYIAAISYSSVNDQNIILEGLAELLSTLSPITGFIDVLGTIKKIKTTHPKMYQGLSFMTKSSKYLSTQFKGTNTGGKSGVYPQVVEMEMALSGTVEASNEIQSATFSFDNPGTSPPDNNLHYGNSLHPAYPYYNEVLGTFGLLKTPEIKRKANLAYTAVNQIGYYEDRYTIQFDLSSLEYVFNPILDINFDNTDIYASYIVETSSYLASSEDDMELFSSGEIRTYVSRELLPIECLHSFAPVFKKSGSAGEEVVANAPPGSFIDGEIFNVYLRITVDYEFLSLDENGNPIRTMQVFTYPVKIVDTYGVTALSCGDKTSVSQINLAEYCSDGRYQANVAKRKNDVEITGEEVLTLNLFVNLYPNPVHERLNIEFALPKETINNSLLGEMTLINTLGQQIVNYGSFEIEHGYVKELDVSQLPSGNYYIQLVSDDFSITKQFNKN